MSTSDDIDCLGPPPEDLELRRRRDAAGRALFAEHAPDLMRIGRFELQSQLGSGGQGVVYLARDPKLGRTVALKRLAVASPRHVDRMRQEALALAKVSHDNVVKVFEVDEDETGRPFLVMELVEGQSLREWLAAEPRAWTTVVDVFIAIGDGLAALHDAGVIHRDIKPHNVMITSDGRAKLVDLGIASWHDHDEPALASDSPSLGAGQGPPIVGTWGYMAPEQRLGRADARSDQFAFCVALHETLYGEPPAVVGGRREGTPGSSSASGTTAPEPPRASRAAEGLRQAPRQLALALARGLDPNPERRHPDMRTLVAALRRVRSRTSRWPQVGLAAMVGSLGLATASLLAPSGGPCAEPDAAQQLWQGERREAVRAAFAATGSEDAAASFTAVDAMLGAAALGLDERRVEVCDGDQDEVTRGHLLGQLGEQHEVLASVMGTLDAVDAETIGDLPGRLASRLAMLHAGPQDACELRELGVGGAVDVDELRRLMRHAVAEGVAGRYDHALKLGDEVLARAQGDALAPLRTQLHLERGRILLEARRLDDAGKDLEEARRLAETHDCHGLGAEALALGVKAHLLDLRPEIDAMETPSKQALEKLDGLGDHHSPRRAEALNSRALVLQKQQRYDDAVEIFEQAIGIREALEPPAPLELSDSLLNLGIVQAKQGRSEVAVETLVRAQVLREQALWPDHISLYRIHASLGRRWLELGEVESAERSIARALQLGRGLGEHSGSLANLHLMMVEVLDRRHEFDRALEYAERADVILEAAYGEHGLERLATLEAIGQVLVDAGRPEDAVPPLEQALDLQARANAKVSALDLAIGRGKLAHAHQQAGQTEVAIRLFDEAWRCFSEDPSLRSNPFYPELLLGRGETLVALGRTSEAIHPLREAVAWWTESDNNPERLAHARWWLAQASCSEGAERDARKAAKRALEYFRSDDSTLAVHMRAEVLAWLEDGCLATD